MYVLFSLHSYHHLYELGLNNVKLASWFDLDFNPRPPANTVETTPEQAAAWDYPVNPQAGAWSWVNGSMVPPGNPLNPGPTPAAPAGGVDVRLSTGPDAQRTHWQYVFHQVDGPCS